MTLMGKYIMFVATGRMFVEGPIGVKWELGIAGRNGW